MTALTANVGTTQRAKIEGAIQAYKVAASIHIYRGAIVAVAQAGAGAGYASPMIADINDAAKQVFVGIALEEKNNSSGSNGDLTIRVRQDSKWKMVLASVTQADIGKLALNLDDATVQLYKGSSASEVVIGRITEISGSDVFVDITERPSRVASGAND